MVGEALRVCTYLALCQDDWSLGHPSSVTWPQVPVESPQTPAFFCISFYSFLRACLSLPLVVEERQPLGTWPLSQILGSP